jgi:hypothetical protein
VTASTCREEGGIGPAVSTAQGQLAAGRAGEQSELAPGPLLRPLLRPTPDVVGSPVTPVAILAGGRRE